MGGAIQGDQSRTRGIGHLGLPSAGGVVPEAGLIPERGCRGDFPCTGGRYCVLL